MGKIKDSSLNKKELLELLEIGPDKLEKIEESSTEQMGLAKSLLKIARISPERESLLCDALAKQLLGKVPKPDEIELD
jgi:hypothetical protein